MAALPGIGASIRISATARFSLISSERLRILLTFTPCSGWSSYRVTVGPQLTFVIWTLTPKLSNVVFNFMAVWRRCSSVLLFLFFCPRTRMSSGGKTYSGFCSSAASISSAVSIFSISLGPSDLFAAALAAARSLALSEGVSRTTGFTSAVPPADASVSSI